jgi:hypothetical protein
VNAKTRWKRRILREHHYDAKLQEELYWGHHVLLQRLGKVGAVYGFRTCARCPDITNGADRGEFDWRKEKGEIQNHVTWRWLKQHPITPDLDDEMAAAGLT